MNESSLIRDGTITSDEDIIGNRLSEDFDFQHVGDNLLSFAIDVWVYEGDVVVTRDDVPEGG